MIRSERLLLGLCVAIFVGMFILMMTQTMSAATSPCPGGWYVDLKITGLGNPAQKWGSASFPNSENLNWTMKGCVVP